MSDWVNIFDLNDTLEQKRAGLRRYYEQTIREDAAEFIAESGGQVSDEEVDRHVARLLPQLEDRINADIVRLIGPQALN